jgi:tRNA(Ile)-lysidine synthase TilS/MesJ
MPNFESMARKYRFRVLGKACRDSNINSLLLAHHEDDQAETVLMRMINGHRTTGLLGIKAVSEIPECYGMYGVHESGGLYQCAEEAQLCLPRDSTTTITTWENVAKNSPQLPAETGGIRVYRPLLNFSKARLIATCQAEKTEWFEDATNKDPTLTMRNTIRHMYSSHSMPAALTKPALLALTAKLQEKSNRQIDIIKSWLSKCSNCDLDTRTGTLQIQFPDLKKLQESLSRTLPKDSGLIAARLLRRVIRLVTYKEHIELSSLHGAVERIFPELLPQQESPEAPTAFTICGALFQPLTATSSEQDLSTSTQKRTWLISCQPYPSLSSMRPSAFFSPTGSTWSPWTLYDGRYWIRIQNHGTETIHVRPFHKDDMSDFRHDIDEKYEAKFRRVLKSAPGSVRWTLPAVALRTEDGNEKVLALPSLGLALPKSQELAKWEIRYKKINTAHLPMAEIPVIKHSEPKSLGFIGSSLKS